MKKISVILDDITEKTLNKLVKLNKCSITDIVNSSILAFAMDTQPVIIGYDELLFNIENAAQSKGFGTLDNWCQERNINKYSMRQLIKRINKGSEVSGFGNTKNKWRDKEDGREFKTHTAWIAHCIKEDFGIDIT